MPYKDLKKNKECQQRYQIEHADEIRQKKRLYDKAHRVESSVYRKAWRLRNKEKYLLYNREKTFKSKYKITRADWSEMVEQRNDKCDICGTIPSTILHVDHDHVTGKIRGLLCAKCNTGLGKLGDNSTGLLRALEYLYSHERGSV